MFVFFFQAEDGIRDVAVTGVQTCALPISFPRWRQKHRALRAAQRAPTHWGLEPDGLLVNAVRRLEPGDLAVVVGAAALPAALRSEEHTSELQSRLHLVCRLLLEKKKKRRRRRPPDRRSGDRTWRTQ